VRSAQRPAGALRRHRGCNAEQSSGSAGANFGLRTWDVELVLTLTFSRDSPNLRPGRTTPSGCASGWGLHREQSSLRIDVARGVPTTKKPRSLERWARVSPLWRETLPVRMRGVRDRARRVADATSPGDLAVPSSLVFRYASRSSHVLNPNQGNGGPVERRSARASRRGARCASTPQPARSTYRPIPAHELRTRAANGEPGARARNTAPRRAACSTSPI
jgi:hypothetical protein